MVYKLRREVEGMIMKNQTVEMDPQRLKEYEFFLAMASLAEERAAKFAEATDLYGSSICRLYKEYAANSRLWAERIALGWTVQSPKEDSR